MLFYGVKALKGNPLLAIFLIMLVSASFYNTLEAKGYTKALSLDVFGSEVVVDTPAHIAYAGKQAWNKDAFEPDLAESGKGGSADIPPVIDTKYPTSQDDALLPDFSALVAAQNQDSRNQIITYTVEDGDTLSEIADQFSIEPNTILWANNLYSGDYLKVGQALDILPTDGVKHEVKKGDTANTLAKKFKANEEDIIAYNHLPADGSLRVADVLVIPNGVMPAPPKPALPPRTLVQTPAPVRLTVANGYFKFPTTGRISQGLHGNNGVDIANHCGTPIYAAADGVVALARTTSSRAKWGASVYQGYGNHIKLSHSNGATTLYAHLEEIFVSQGQEVRQGDVVALMGGGFEHVNGRLVRMEGAGRSTGCHLHFETRGASNPFAPRRGNGYRVGASYQ